MINSAKIHSKFPIKMKILLNFKEFHPILKTQLEQYFMVEDDPELSNSEFNLKSSNSGKIQNFSIFPFNNFHPESASRKNSIHFVLFPPCEIDHELTTMISNFFQNNQSKLRKFNFYIVQETEEIVELVNKFSSDMDEFQFWGELKSLGSEICKERDQEIVKYLTSN